METPQAPLQKILILEIHHSGVFFAFQESGGLLTVFPPGTFVFRYVIIRTKVFLLDGAPNEDKLFLFRNPVGWCYLKPAGFDIKGKSSASPESFSEKGFLFLVYDDP